MATLGRDEKALLERVASAFERNAEATEKMVALAEQEVITVERGPSVCPHCGKLNPEVTQLAQDGSGPLDGFVFVGETHCCNKAIYAIPEAFTTVRHKDEAAEVLDMKIGGRA